MQTLYGALCADPPWQFKQPSANRHDRITNHYQTMPLDDIKALPVRDLAAKHCALFLWAIDTHLREALEVIDAWGFTFRTVGFTWAKTNKSGSYFCGLGWWSRSNCEMALLATKGKPPRRAKDVRRLVVAPRREHSRKPDEVYDAITRLVDGPYCELFARTRRPGWDTMFSDEPDRFPIIEGIEQELNRQRTVGEEVIERAADLYRALAKL